jgi:hypothetical protein
MTERASRISQEFIDELLSHVDIAEVVGRDVKLRKSGANYTGLCPFHDDRSPSFSVIVGKQFYYCHACQASGNAITFLVEHVGLRFVDAIRDLALTAGMQIPSGLAEGRRRDAGPSKDLQAPPASRTASATHPTLAADYRAFWRDLGPVADVGSDYLTSRGCVVPPVDADLRYARALRHPSGYVGPALVALVTDAVTREPLTLHRTWIKPDGKKADVQPPRLLLGKHRKQGGVIRLWPDEDVGQGLAIAEGIETALTVAHAFTPVWSVIDAGNMAGLPVLDGVRSLLIAADHDDAGLRGAEQCAARWHAAGVEVRIAKSPNQGQDLNDFARAA